MRPTQRLLRAAAAVALTAAAVPLAAAPAGASQSGDDHKVTLCHRTNSENNPYVVITIDKAGVFKTGHDSHDEGGVYQPGDKARGVRWGDIIPPFDYYASPQDEKSGTQSHYDGLNYGADGQQVLANGCEVPQPPGGQAEPGGSLSGECTDADDFVVSGRTDSDGATDVAFRLAATGQAPIAVPTDDEFSETITAAPGTVVTLEYRVGSGDWTSTGETVTVTDCPPTPPTETTPASGSFTTECTATAALVDIGDLDRGTNTGGRFQLVVNGTPQRVTDRQQDIPVAAESQLVLRYVAADGTVTVLQQGQAPKACPPVTTPASGDLTATCTATGALVDIGTLSTGSATGGRFELAVNGATQTVSSGQQDIVVPGGAELVLRYVPDSGAVQVLERTTAPQACPTPPTPPAPQPERGLTVTKTVTPTGPAQVGDTLTYRLTVTTTGNAEQSGVTVSDYLPGYRPGTASGTTTYVAGSATCDTAGSCTASYDPATHQVSWALGTMAAGASRYVTFAVTIDRPARASDGSIAAFDVVNLGVAGSSQVAPTTSNEVRTPVAAVEGVKIGNAGGSGGGGGASTPSSPGNGGTEVLPTQSGMLPHTGTSGRLPLVLALAGLLLLAGAAMVAAPAMLRRR